MEKQILEEIVAARRRLLEAEVRRELMMEPPTNGHMFGYPHHVSVSSRDHLHEIIAREMEKIRGNLTTESANGCDLGLLFMRPAEDATSEGGKEGQTGTQMGTLQTEVQGRGGKPRVVLMGPKPDEAVSKGKRSGSPKLGQVENTKRPRKDWTCELCQISNTSQKALEDHLKGRRHKAKEASASGDSGATGENRVGPKRFIRGYRFWCDVCKVGAYNLKFFHSHLKGRRHISMAGGSESRIQNPNRIRYTRDNILQLRDAAAEASEDILKVKEEVEAELVEEPEHLTYYSEVVRGAISIGLEKSPACVNLVLNTLTTLFGVNEESIRTGCLLYAESLEDLPKAPDSFGEILGGLVVAGILEFRDVKEILTKVGDDFYGKAVFGGVMKILGSVPGGKERLEAEADVVRECEGVF